MSTDLTGEAEAPQPRTAVLIGTGMPQTTLLEAFGQWIYDAFGETPYHVGSSTHSKTWRDVDVRLILDDVDFDAMFPGYQDASQRDSKWSLICAAISTLGKQLTGLPIDFQIQSMTGANKTHGGGFRNPLWLYNHDSVEAAQKRRAEKQDSGDE